MPAHASPLPAAEARQAAYSYVSAGRTALLEVELPCVERNDIRVALDAERRVLSVSGSLFVLDRDSGRRMASVVYERDVPLGAWVDVFAVRVERVERGVVAVRIAGGGIAGAGRRDGRAVVGF